MPSQAHGFDSTVVVGKETTAGTIASSFKWVGITDSFEPEENRNLDARKGLGSRAPFMIRTGAKEVDASMTTVLQNGRALYMALGKVATTGDATNGYVHTLSAIGKGEELPTFSVQNNIAGVALLRTYLGGKVDTLTLTASAEEAVEVETELQFLDVIDTGSAVAVTADLNNYFMFHEGVVKINTATVANVTEFELEIANNLERRFALNGSEKPARIEEGSLDLTASLTFDLLDKTQWDLFKNGSDITVELILTDVSNVKNQIAITLSGGKYDTNGISLGAEDGVEQELEALFTGIAIVAKDATNANLF